MKKRNIIKEVKLANYLFIIAVKYFNNFVE